MRFLQNQNIDREDIKKLLESREYRISKRDGESYLLTQDYHPTRMNLELENNIIKKITLG